MPSRTGHRISPTASEFTRDDILTCITSDDPPVAYTADPGLFQKEADVTLRKHNQSLTGVLLEAAQSGNFKPFANIGSYAAHILSTYKEICELCRGACKQQGPREFVPEDYFHHNIFINLKDLIENQPLYETDKELREFIETCIPLEKLASEKAKGDRI